MGQGQTRFVQCMTALTWILCACSAPVDCPEDLSLCEGRCVDLHAHPRHCGACEHSCGAHLLCVRGECVSEHADSCAQLGLLDCGGDCVDPLYEPLHCGGCGRACSADESCEEGGCRTGTARLLFSCGEELVDVWTDVEHCGGCAQSCGELELCIEGACRSPCVEGGLEVCAGQCVDLNKDPGHCGGCFNACGLVELCIDGSCNDSSCNGDLLRCPDLVHGWQLCVDPSTHPDACGDCETSCAALEVCAGGQCVRELAICSALGLIACEVNGADRCVDPRVDPMNCGGCGVRCAAHERCSASRCARVQSLDAGLMDSAALDVLAEDRALQGDR